MKKMAVCFILLFTLATTLATAQEFRGTISGTVTDVTGASIPGHPFTTLAFIAASAWIVVQALAHDPRNGVLGIGLLLAGWPVFLLWRRAARRQAS